MAKNLQDEAKNKPHHSGQPGDPQTPTTNLHVPVTPNMFSMRHFDAEKDLPIVYSREYNFAIIGLELFHQFDTFKYSKLAEYLNDLFQDTIYVHPSTHDELGQELAPDSSLRSVKRLRFMRPNRPIDLFELAAHHSSHYLDQLVNDKSFIARIVEVWALNLVPMFMIQNRLVNSHKFQVSGTIFAFLLAMQHGWALNLGGGFHGASTGSGETFCLFSDVFLAIRYVWRRHPMQKFMIIDLDAHQAVGLERDLAEMDQKKRKQIYMVDMFNTSIQPPDSRADAGIDLRVELSRYTGDATYIAKLEESLKSAYSKFKPSLVIYIAGQDCLKDDQLGLLNVSEEGLRRRDELVFSYAVERHRCPIVMLLGGGYSSHGDRIQAESIRNLYNKNLIWGGHRSGSRTLSRPRKKTNTDTSKQKHTRKTYHRTNERKHHEAKSSLSHQPYVSAIVPVMKVQSTPVQVPVQVQQVPVYIPVPVQVQRVPTSQIQNQSSQMPQLSYHQLNLGHSGREASQISMATPQSTVSSSSSRVPASKVDARADAEFLKRLQEDYKKP